MVRNEVSKSGDYILDRWFQKINSVYGKNWTLRMKIQCMNKTGNLNLKYPNRTLTFETESFKDTNSAAEFQRMIKIGNLKVMYLN